MDNFDRLEELTRGKFGEIWECVLDDNDGGMELIKALVAFLFHDAAYNDAAAGLDMNITEELLEVARNAAMKHRCYRHCRESQIASGAEPHPWLDAAETVAA